MVTRARADRLTGVDGESDSSNLDFLLLAEVRFSELFSRDSGRVRVFSFSSLLSETRFWVRL